MASLLFDDLSLLLSLGLLRLTHKEKQGVEAAALALQCELIRYS